MHPGALSPAASAVSARARHGGLPFVDASVGCSVKDSFATLEPLGPLRVRVR
jgi:hypothetical protein